jgi:hypothetical protein
MLLIRLASSCVIHHDFGGILGLCSRMVLEFEPEDAAILGRGDHTHLQLRARH